MKQLFMTEICNINVQCIYFLLIFLIIIILLLIIYYKKNFKKFFTKNTKEIESLIQSYSKNVIASKTDTKGIITYTSEAFEKISGYTKKVTVKITQA